MTEETPGKILSLLGVSCTSLLFLFAVSFSNASFERTQDVFPDPFNPSNVVSALDNTAASYSHFLAVNLFAPAVAQAAIVTDTTAWIADNLGIEVQSSQQFAEGPSLGRVAGATTIMPESAYTAGGSLTVDTIYAFLIGS